MNPNNGGPAYPVLELNRKTGDVCDQHMGMSLRDYFAAAALPLAARRELLEHEHFGGEELDVSADMVAKRAYWMADAMLKARKA